jgi:hypothetical protein
MARTLSGRERNIIIAGAMFVVCFLVVWFAVRPARDKLAELKAVVRSMTDQYKEIQRIEAQHRSLKRETEPVMQRILQRRKGFDLSAFMAETEARLNFARTRETPLGRTPYGDFEKRTSTFFYDDKSLDQVVGFLKELEKPENVIGVENVRVWIKSPTERSKLNLELRLATVVPVKPGS